MQYRIGLILVLAGICTLAQAQKVYKSVDAEGNAVFSDKPPAKGGPSETIELKPAPNLGGPSPALDRLVDDQADRDWERNNERLTRQKDLAVATAELNQAKADLEQAKVYREGDWQSLAGGGRKVRPEHAQRVQRAEQRVDAAQQRVRDLRP